MFVYGIEHLPKIRKLFLDNVPKFRKLFLKFRNLSSYPNLGTTYPNSLIFYVGDR